MIKTKEKTIEWLKGFDELLGSGEHNNHDGIRSTIYHLENSIPMDAEVKVQTVEEELNHIAKRLAALSGMPYCWEDILDRLHHGYQLPFKFEK